MEQAEICLKEYERGLDLFVSQEKNLNRLAFWRTGLLIAAVLFFGSYVAQFEEINGLRRQMGPLAPAEREWTVFGYLNEHQKVEHSVFSPDEHAQALMQLVGKLRTFLSEDLTVENQSDRTMGEFLKLVDKKPAHIKIENSYLPNLTMPVSYSAMSLAVFAVSLTSFFYFAYRRQKLTALMLYVRRNLSQITSGDASIQLHPGAFSRGLLADATWSLASLRKTIRLAGAEEWKETKTLLRSVLVGRKGASPYRLLNNVLAVLLFARLTFLTAHIVLAERGITINALREFGLMVALVVLPSLVLYLANRWYSGTGKQGDPLELLTDTGEF